MLYFGDTALTWSRLRRNLSPHPDTSDPNPALAMRILHSNSISRLRVGVCVRVCGVCVALCGMPSEVMTLRSDKEFI